MNKIFILALMCVAFQKSDSLNRGSDIFRSPIVIDRSYSKRIKINCTEAQIINYKALYIGKYTDTIRLVDGVKNPDHRRLQLTHFGTYSALIIKVDTSQLITGKNIEYFNNGNDKREIFYEAYPVFLYNTQGDTVYMGSGMVLPLRMEALDIENNWRFIEQYRMYYCGTGLPKFYLPDNGIILTSAPKYTGEFKTKLRLRYKEIVSNEFYGSINLKQFDIEADSVRLKRFGNEY